MLGQKVLYAIISPVPQHIVLHVYKCSLTHGTTMAASLQLWGFQSWS